MTFCNDVRDDSKAYRLCEFIRKKYNYKKNDFDKCLLRTVHKDKERAVNVCTDPGAEITPEQVRETAFSLIEKELFDQKDKLRRGREFCSPLLRFFEDVEDLKVPWITKDKYLFLHSELACEKAKEIISDGGVLNGSSGYKKMLARKAWEYISKPKEDGGLGLEFDPFHNSPQKNYDEVVEKGFGTCHEITLMVMLFRQWGLDAHPVDIYTNNSGQYIDHMGIGVKITRDQVMIVDPQLGIEIVSQSKTSLKKWTFVSMSDFMADHLNNRANLNAKYWPDDEKYSFMRKNYGQALLYGASNYLVLYCAANFEDEYNNNLEVAVRHALSSMRANPYYPNTYLLLIDLYEKLGVYNSTTSYCDRYKALTGNQHCSTEVLYSTY